MISTHAPNPQTFLPSASDAGPSASCIVLFEASLNGKIMVEGEGAAMMLQRVWAIPELGVGSGVEVGSGQVYRLRSDLFFVHTPPANEGEALRLLTDGVSAGDGLVTVTPVTHGRSELHLMASARAEQSSSTVRSGVEEAERCCRTLLSRVCGLDFGATAFPNLTARFSSLAKTRQLVIRRDLDGYLSFAIIGPRSLGAYLLATLADAGRDFGIVVQGDDGVTR